MYQIPAGAIARLVMVNGSLVSEAEVAQILESYNYQQDGGDPNRWLLMDAGPADGGAALVFGSEGEIIDVYSDSDENILNLNYIAMRIGWSDCEIYATDQGVQDKLLLRLVNVGIANTPAAVHPSELEVPSAVPAPAHTPAATAAIAPVVEAPAPLVTAPAAPAIDAMNEDHEELQLMRVRLALAEQRNEELAEENQALSAKVRRLESIGTATTPAPPRNGEERQSDDSGLVRIVEKHLLSLLDLSAVDQSGLMAELKRHGYSVDVKLVRS